MQSPSAVHTSTQLGAPLHVMTQSPPVQLVIEQLCASWHVSWQSLPPAQSRLHEPAVQSSMQSPPAHCIAHDAAPLHVW